ncbi:MAG: lytic transglycosylase domain-containing protein [Terriglobia bacterium]
MSLLVKFPGKVPPIVWLLGGIALSLLSPAVSPAQSEGLSGDWRDRIDARLDQQLAALTAPAENPPAATAMHNHEETSTARPNQPGSFMPVRREPWLPAVANILGEHGLPLSLMGVAAVESGFNPAALSPKGARGLWQLMPETARRYGLTVEPGRDDRLDTLKSTHAAARYIQDLFAQFRDWPLVFAAYNAGETRVERALDRNGAGDFWTLSRRGALPEETRQYVPAVLAKIGGGTFTNYDGATPEGGNSESGRLVYATSVMPPEIAERR